MLHTEFIYIFIALLCSAFISFTTTPLARVLAYKLGAIDTPKDARRIHKIPMPLMGGFAIFLAFSITVFAFCPLSKEILGLLLGALIIVITGIFDDVYNLKPLVKLLFQIISAVVIVLSGTTFVDVSVFGAEIYFGKSMEIFFTIFWIVAMTNAVNIIDGLDGLSCGISAISSLSILLASFFMKDTSFSAILLTAILAGSCIGFLPFNFNPAKIFMGDTGSMFLGFTLAVISIQGVFKATAIYAFWVPFIAFALPLTDTAFAFFRRLIHGKSPFSADRGHIHHKLIDMGFNQKQSVTILYATSAIFGISSILFAIGKPVGAAIIIFSAFAILILNWLCVSKNNETRKETGLGLSDMKKDDASTDQK